MKLHEQLQAFFKFLGWEPQYHGGQLWAWKKDGETKYPRELPNFEKVEAMLELEQALTWEETETYEKLLVLLLEEKASGEGDSILPAQTKAFHADAEIRRKAFLILKNLWDSPGTVDLWNIAIGSNKKAPKKYNNPTKAKAGTGRELHQIHIPEAELRAGKKEFKGWILEASQPEIKAGDLIQVRDWNPESYVKNGVVREVIPIEATETGLTVQPAEENQRVLHLITGFKSEAKVLQYLSSTHGLPFKGTLVIWE